MASTTTTASSVTSGGVLTVASVAGITTRQTVQLTGTTFGGLFVAPTTYYVIAVGANTITLSLTSYGTAISIAGGSGSLTVKTGPAVGAGVDNIVSADVTGDYNTIQGILAKVLGPPTDASPRYGYNQTLTSSQVSVGNRVTLNQWTNLRSDMIRARGHQTGSASESNNISLPTALSLISEPTRSEFLTYANLIDTYRDTLGPSQSSSDNTITAQRIDDWNGNLTSTLTINFGDNPTMRAFFNAGGYINFSVNMSGNFNSFSSVKDGTWVEMFSKMGTITFDRSGTTLAQGSTGTTTNIGFFNLTNSYQTIFTKPAPSGNYSTNAFVIVAQANSGVLTIQLQYNDTSVGLGGSYIAGGPTAGLGTGSQTQTIQGGATPGGVGDEYIDGIITQTVVIWRPSGSYVSIASPTVTLTGDFQNASGAVYGLSANKYAVNEGDTVTVKLQTRNVANGTPVTYYCNGAINYTVNGVTTSRISAGATDGFFTINNNEAQVAFTIANNLYTDGLTTFTVNLYNGLANTTIYINDTSTTPINNAFYGSVGNTSWLAPAGVRTANILIVGGGGGGGNFGGGGGGGGQARILVTNIAPGNSYPISVGGGGANGTNGTASYFNGNAASGGNPGNSGTSTGHGGTHTGGSGGQSGTSQSGGSGGATTGTTMTLGGGGGGGTIGAGSNGSTTTGGRGGAGLAFTYYGINTIYIAGGGGGGGTVGSDPANPGYLSPGYFGAGTGGGMDTVGRTAPGYGGGGGGGGVSLNPSTAQTANTSGQITAYLGGLNGGAGGQGLVWIFWP